MQKAHVKLTESDQRYLTTLLSKGELSARCFRRPTALLQLHRGNTLDHVANSLSVHRVTVANWRDAYNEIGLQCLQDKARSGRPIIIDGEARAHTTALACSTPPEGRCRWTSRLLADKAVELGYGEGLSHASTGHPQKNALQPHLKRTWCIGTMNAEYLARMECLLWLYQQPYDARFPVVCFDERPCFLIGEAVAGQAMQGGKVRCEHYPFEKLGSCALLAALEPKTGKRLARFFDQRRKREYAQRRARVVSIFPNAASLERLATAVLMEIDEDWQSGARYLAFP